MGYGHLRVGNYRSGLVDNNSAKLTGKQGNHVDASDEVSASNSAGFSLCSRDVQRRRRQQIRGHGGAAEIFYLVLPRETDLPSQQIDSHTHFRTSTHGTAFFRTR